VGQLRALPQASGRMDVVRHAGSELKPGAADRLLSKLDVDDEICSEKWLHDEGTSAPRMWCMHRDSV
jgi:hypothetical protein